MKKWALFGLFGVQTNGDLLRTR